jgi:hypothetical protein
MDAVFRSHNHAGIDRGRGENLSQKFGLGRIVCVALQRGPDVQGKSFPGGERVERLEQVKSFRRLHAACVLREGLGSDANGLDFVAAFLKSGLRLPQHKESVSNLRAVVIAVDANEGGDRPNLGFAQNISRPQVRDTGNRQHNCTHCRTAVDGFPEPLPAGQIRSSGHSAPSFSGSPTIVAEAARVGIAVPCR